MVIGDYDSRYGIDPNAHKATEAPAPGYREIIVDEGKSDWDIIPSPEVQFEMIRQEMLREKNKGLRRKK